MTSPRHPITFAPRLMSPVDAAQYLGISAGLLRTLGLPRKRIGERRVVYDRLDLDAYASNLPTEGESEANSCDSIFGAEP